MSRHPNLARYRQTVSTVLAVVVSVLFAFGLPVVLAIGAGLPVPSHWDGHTVLGYRGLFDLVILVVWILWAVQLVLLVRATVAEVRQHASGRTTPFHRQWLAVRLAAACMALWALVAGGAAVASAAPPRQPAAAVQAAPAAARAQATTLDQSETATAAMVVTPTSAAPTPAPTPSTYTVQPGDTLWSIAEELYGTGERDATLANVNLGRVMTDGRVFDTEDLIMPGWVLTVPSDTPAAPPPAAPSDPPVATAPAGGVQDRGGRPAASPGPVPALSLPGLDHGRGLGHGHGSAEAGREDAAGRGRQEDSATATPPSGHHEVPALPTGLGLGTLGAAIVGWRVARNRRAARLGRRPGQVYQPLRPRTQAADVLLATNARTTTPTMLAHGLCHLTHAVGPEQDAVPPICLVRVGPRGLALVLDGPGTEAPGAFSTAEPFDGSLGGRPLWFLPATTDAAALEGAGDGEPWLPALVPLGEVGGESFFLPVEPGRVVGVTGPAASASLAAMQVVASAFAWTGSRLIVTADPVVAAEEANLLGDLSATIERARVLYFGSPGDLDARSRQRVGIVTAEPNPSADVSVYCETGVTRVEPFGIATKPAVLAPAEAEAVADVLAASRAEPEWTLADVVPDTPAALAVLPPEKPPPEPGAVEVRVLVPAPRIDGATGAVPSTRADRAVELLAYLVLAGTLVPTDEARAEALATSEGEGSLTTLRVVASTLRGWIGADHLPHATRGGYQALGVTSDLGRLRQALAVAGATEDREVKVEVLRQALALIEGRPLSRTKMGWGWWTAMYERHAQDAACDVACLLAPLLAEAGDGRGARWAIEQARYVDPWSEVLYRTAMYCAGKTHNAGWVVREMAACERMIDELIPGATPSTTTVEVYQQALTQAAA